MYRRWRTTRVVPLLWVREVHVAFSLSFFSLVVILYVISHWEIFLFGLWSSKQSRIQPFDSDTSSLTSPSVPHSFFLSFNFFFVASFSFLSSFFLFSFLSFILERGCCLMRVNREEATNKKKLEIIDRIDNPHFFCVAKESRPLNHATFILENYIYLNKL